MLLTAVFDTNVLISALLSLRGTPFRCLGLAKEGVVQSVTCQEILDEFQRKLQTKFSYPEQHAILAVEQVKNFSRLVTLARIPRTVVADPSDDKVLECAIVGGATHIVTGDRQHLLPLGKYQNISIVSPADFFTLAIAP